MYELAPQANQLASKGRYGDSMLVHMNPAEVGIMNAMSGDKMTINPDTGQPEAFAFLLPLLGGLTGAGIGAAGGLTGLGITSAIGGGALGTGLGKFAETGSLKQALTAGATSYLTAGLVDKFANAAAFPALDNAISTVTDPLMGAGATTAGLGSAVDTATTTGLGSAVDTATTTGLGGLNIDPITFTPGFSPVARNIPGFGFDPVSALGRAAAGSLGATAAFPEYPEFNDNREIYDIPEAAPPTRRLRSMPSDFAQNNTGEFRFFEDPAREKIGENARNFFPEGSTADRETKYAQYGGPVRMDLGGKIEPVTAGNASKSFDGMMKQFDPQEVYDRGGKLPGIMGNFFGVSDLGRFSGLSDEEMLLLKEKKKARRMQEGGSLEMEEDVSLTEDMPMDDDLRSESDMEKDAMIFNAGVNAVMCESGNAAQDLQMFVDRFGMERLHQIICEIMEMAQEETEIEGELTKEDKPVAMEMGGSVDTIPASLEGKQSYLLAENEYIIPEPVVRAIGNGNVDAGADAFDQLIQNVKAVA